MDKDVLNGAILLEGDLGFVPLADFVLLKEIPAGKTAGGIALPEGAETGPRKAKILRVGPGRVTEEGVRIPPDVKAGDIVFMAFAYSQPQEIELRGERCLVTRCRDLVGLAA